MKRAAKAKTASHPPPAATPAAATPTDAKQKIELLTKLLIDAVDNVEKARTKINGLSAVVQVMCESFARDPDSVDLTENHDFFEGLEEIHRQIGDAAMDISEHTDILKRLADAGADAAAAEGAAQ
jgi:hypothetical protein